MWSGRIRSVINFNKVDFPQPFTPIKPIRSRSSIVREICLSSHTSIGYLEQMGGLEKEQTVWHEMHNVFQPLLDAQARMRELEQELANNSEAAAEEYHRLQTYFESNDGY